MTLHFHNFSHEYGIAPQSDRSPRCEAEGGRSNHDVRLRAAFWWTAIVVGLLFWGAIAYGVSLLSLKVLAT